MFIKPCESLARTQKFGLTILACAATTLIATPHLLESLAYKPLAGDAKAG
jgi:hypothetical protein